MLASQDGSDQEGFSPKMERGQTPFYLMYPAFTRHVQPVLQRCDYPVYKKTENKLLLTQRHKYARLKCSTDKVAWGRKNWVVTVFSDNKTSNLDGPNKFKHY